MASVSDCSTLTSGARLGSGMVASATSEKQCEDRHLQDLILGDGLGDVFRKDVDDELLPAFVRDGGRSGSARRQGSAIPTPAWERFMATSR